MGQVMKTHAIVRATPVKPFALVNEKFARTFSMDKAVPRQPRLRLLMVAVVLSVLPLCNVNAQRRDAVAERLGLTRENGSLPIWEKPSSEAVENLSQQARSSNEAIMLVGSPDRGYGTAFVISKENRLLATNAHVADIMHPSGQMLAIRNGSSEIYEIEQAWYHPGLLRFKGNGIEVRSQRPTDGDVDPASPDVAVLRIKAGPAIPVQLTFATADEVCDLFAQPVAMMGFPGYDTTAWPQLGQKAQATFHQGVISRITDFNLNASVSPEEAKRVQHTMSSWGGFSGSPIIIPNGHVVALHNMSRKVSRGSETRSIPHGVRVDCLWELICYHKLDELVPIPVSRSQFDLGRFDKPRPQDEQYHKAIERVNAAWLLILNREHSEAVEVASEAIELAPGFATAYRARAMAYMQYGVANYQKLGSQDRVKYARLASRDMKQAIELEPTNISLLVGYAECAVNERIGAGIPRSGLGEFREVYSKLLETQGLSDAEKATIYAARSGTQPTPDSALKDANTAIDIRPWWLGGYNARYNIWLMSGNSGRARNDRAIYEKLEKAWAANTEAWQLATSSDSVKRDGERALEQAKKAYKLTDGNCLDMVATLSAAYAELGDFDSAIKHIREAIEMTEDKNDLDTLRRMERTFAAQKPYRD